MPTVLGQFRGDVGLRKLSLPAKGQAYWKDAGSTGLYHVINAGGIINVAREYYGTSSEEQVRAEVDRIAERLKSIFAEAEASARPTNIIADELARRIVSAGPSDVVVAAEAPAPSV